jgi:HlyD family secretion protein
MSVFEFFTRKSPYRTSIWMLAAGLLMLCLAGGYAWLGTAQASVDQSRNGKDDPSENRFFKVQARTVSKLVHIAGVIAPGTATSIAAPFSGAIIKTCFAVGQRVEAGDVLLQLDTVELETQRSEAGSAVINAQQKVAELRDWKNSAEVLRAQRAVERGKQQLQKLRSDLAEVRKLFSLGIVAKQEVDGLIDQEREAANALISANEELSGIVRKGGAHAIQVAAIEFVNAKRKLQQLEDKLASAKVLAPTSGVIVQPSTSGDNNASQESRELIAGAKITEGQKLLTIASSDRLQIRGKVPEVDIAALKIGLSMRATTVAFPNGILSGRIAAIASQASREGDMSMPGFDLVAQIDNWSGSPEQKIRLGMTANMEIVVYERPDILVVPPSAVTTDDKQNHQVKKRNPGTGKFDAVNVTLGMSFPEGVEVLSGLAPGDEIVP